MNGYKSRMVSALGALALGVIPAEAKVLYHFNGNGAYAGAYGNGKVYTGLEVSQGGTPRADTVSLHYYTSDCDTLGGPCTGIEAYGPIPGRDFNANGKNATLSTNTSSNPNFTARQWTYDPSTGQYSESPIDLGTIKVDWKSSGLSSTRSVGTTISTYLNTTTKSTGQAAYTDASVSGTVGGIPLDVYGGQVGTYSNNEISVERK